MSPPKSLAAGLMISNGRVRVAPRQCFLPAALCLWTTLFLANDPKSICLHGSVHQESKAPRLTARPLPSNRMAKLLLVTTGRGFMRVTAPLTTAAHCFTSRRRSATFFLMFSVIIRHVRSICTECRTTRGDSIAEARLSALDYAGIPIIWYNSDPTTYPFLTVIPETVGREEVRQPALPVSLSACLPNLPKPRHGKRTLYDNSDVICIPASRAETTEP